MSFANSKSMLLALVLLVVCPCVSCLGRDTGLTRQQVWRHTSLHGIADPGWCARLSAAEQLHRTGWIDLQQDDIVPDQGGEDVPHVVPDQGGEEDEEDEDPEFWEDDPFYHSVKPHLEQLFNDTEGDAAGIHALTLDLLRWKRSNRITDRGTDELLGLLYRHHKQDGGYPRNLNAAYEKFKGFKVIHTKRYEMCGKGCHRFEQGSAAGKTCPVCETPTRDSNGKSTTCTFTKYSLKDKLRLLYANPQMAALLKSHVQNATPANMRGEGEERRTYSIYGTYTCCIYGIHYSSML